MEYRFLAGKAAFLGYSLLYDDSIARGRPVFDGGVRHLGGTLESYGQINAGDSLAAIRDLVFERKEITAAQLIAALDADFEGFADVRRRLLAVPKYGNDDDRVDALQQRLHASLCRVTAAHARRAGLDSYLIVIINNLMHCVLGRITGATPDGRKRGEALANANNPSSGMDRAGTTAFLASLVKLDTRVHAGAVQNMKFSPELFAPALRPKLDALLDTYWAKGGAQAMITVVNRGDLEAALREPEKWGNLMVRVGGFSARYVDLPPDVQQEILRRTLNG
jgi:pyruvate-formate lyase